MLLYPSFMEYRSQYQLNRPRFELPMISQQE